MNSSHETLKVDSEPEALLTVTISEKLYCYWVVHSNGRLAEGPYWSVLRLEQNCFKLYDLCSVEAHMSYENVCNLNILKFVCVNRHKCTLVISKHFKSANNYSVIVI